MNIIIYSYEERIFLAAFWNIRSKNALETFFLNIYFKKIMTTN